MTAAVMVLVISAILEAFLSTTLEAEQTALLPRFGWLALGLTTLAGVIAFVAGALFIRRACKTLHEVCDKVRNVEASAGKSPLEFPGAPEEIREVVDAVSSALGRAHDAAERTRLLTTGLAHELGSPIQNLIGETEVALMSERPSDYYREVLGSHLEELRDIGRTVGNLMTMCMLSERTQADLEEFDLGREAVLRLRREHAYALRRGVKLAIEQVGDLTLVGDREALLLAVANVVANAIDWSPSGGEVTLALRGDEGTVAVIVDDSGPGIADAERAKIFEPFYRSPCTNGKRAGYGLGLSLTKQAIETHGGVLEVADSPLGGARFSLRLPRTRRPHAAVA